MSTLRRVNLHLLHTGGHVVLLRRFHYSISIIDMYQDVLLPTNTLGYQGACEKKARDYFAENWPFEKESLETLTHDSCAKKILDSCVSNSLDKLNILCHVPLLPKDLRFIEVVISLNGPFTLSISVNGMMLLVTSLLHRLNYLDSLINRASQCKYGLQPQLIRYNTSIDTDTPNQSLTLSVNGP